jgi:fermentation-respiration switch protein FrsA (DUF1100 family)
MRKSVLFTSKGINCSAFLYVPDNLKSDKKSPAIVMAHGLSGVKEQALTSYAERFTAKGFITLVFDYRYFGDSEGEPRSQLFPLEMVEDYQNAISWISNQGEVDPQRIGIWGTSLSGGLVLYVGAFDKRVKAIVAQVPGVFNPVSRYVSNPTEWQKSGEFLMQDRVERYKNGAVNYMKVVDQKGQRCVLPGEAAYKFFSSSLATAPNWRNQLTVESLEKMREFDPVTSIGLISPIPILLIPAERDGLVSPESIRLVYDKIAGIKAITFLPITHFEIYHEPWLSKAADLALDWYGKYL